MVRWSLGVAYYTLWERRYSVCRDVSMDVPWRYMLHVGKIWGRHSDGIFGRSQDVGRGCPLALHRGPYGDVHRISLGDVLRTSYFDVLTTSLGYFPWRYIEDHMETCKRWWKSNVVLYGYRHFQCIHENRQYLSRHCRRYLNKVWNFKL